MKTILFALLLLLTLAPSVAAQEVPEQLYERTFYETLPVSFSTVFAEGETERTSLAFGMVIDLAPDPESIPEGKVANIESATIKQLKVTTLVNGFDGTSLPDICIVILEFSPINFVADFPAMSDKVTDTLDTFLYYTFDNDMDTFTITIIQTSGNPDVVYAAQVVLSWEIVWRYEDEVPESPAVGSGMPLEVLLIAGGAILVLVLGIRQWRD